MEDNQEKLLEEIANDEGRAGQTQRDGDQHDTQQRVEQLGIHLNDVAHM